MHLRRFALVALALLGLLGAQWVPAGRATAASGLYPDLRTVVPTQLQLVNAQQRETLRFSNGVANTGPGPWAVRPEPPVRDATTTTTAVQEVRDSGARYRCGAQPQRITECYNVVSEHIAGTFVFHPAHNHWHIGDVALFEIRKGGPSAAIVGPNAIKTTFCLIDWYKLDDNAPRPERTFQDCATSFQGVSAGWVDQYHQALEGQSLDLTGVPDADDYYLVSTSNFARRFLESDYANNAAWVRFRLYREGNGNRKVEVTAHSPCGSPALCGEQTPNR